MTYGNIIKKRIKYLETNDFFDSNAALLESNVTHI